MRQKIERLQDRGIVLWAEKGKLKFRAKEGTMTSEIMSWLKNNKQDVIDYLASNYMVDHDEENRYEPFSLTGIQNAYLVGRNSEYELGGTGCHSYTEFKFDNIDCARLEKAWHELILKHDMLRAVFSFEGYQKVLEKPAMPGLVVNDLSANATGIDSSEFKEIRKSMEDKNYEIGSWPMHQFAVTKFADYDIVHFSIDMLIADFVSVNIMMSDLIKLYEGEQLSVSQNSLTFRDVVLEDVKNASLIRKTGKYSIDEEYWKNRVKEMPAEPVLPVKNEVSEKTSFTRRIFTLSPDKWDRLKTVAKNNEITSSVVIMTLYIETISRWSYGSSFCINLTLNDRDREYLSENAIVGDFTTIDVFEARDTNEKFIDRAKRNQLQLVKDLEHKSFSGIEVLKELGRDKGEKIVIPVVYTSTLGSKEDDIISEKSELIYGVSRTPQVWIDCQVVESAGRLVVNWDVRDGVFEKEIIESMFAAFTEAVEYVADNEKSLNQSEVIKFPEKYVAERKALNDTDKDIAKSYMYDGFLSQVKNAPERRALVASDVEYNYRDLAGYVQDIRNKLKDAGIKAHDKVALIEDKSVYQIAAVLAIILEGGVYVPIAVNQPDSRKLAIVQDAEVLCIVGRDDLAEAGVSLIDLSDVKKAEEFDFEPAMIEYTDPAYIIFTSGSTGRPKGVVISHKAAMNTINDVNDRFDITGDDVILGVSSLTFDLSVYDIFGGFAVGATLVLPDPGKEKSPAHWSELFQKYKISVWNSVPAILSLYMDYRSLEGLEKNSSMKCIMLSGDLIPRTFPKEIKEAFTNATVYSLGGATEAAIWSIYYPITDYDRDKNIPYGMPLSNQYFYILDSNDRVCPDGVTGEICIAGDGLADGYYGDKELTDQKFYVNDSLNRRIYRTGDLGFYGEGGIIEFVGRKDYQVKVNGHRIELGEIESVLLDHPMVDRAVATVFEDDDQKKSLEAFVVLKHGDNIDTDYRNKAALLGEEVGIAADAALGNRTKKAILDWKKCSERNAVVDMLWVFRSSGVLGNVDEKYTYEQILDKIRPDSDYEHIVKRWLNVLITEDILAYQNDCYALTSKGEAMIDRDMAWTEFAQLEEDVDYSHKLFEYQRKSSDLLVEQIRGNVRGLDLFFPGGSTDVAKAAYQDNVVNNMLNQAVKKALVGIVKLKEERLDRRINILEIGAGVGGTSDVIIPELKEFDVSYCFTDVSNFFITKAKERYKDYDFVSYGLFDINNSFENRGVIAQAYDIVLCANVLHNAKNCPEVLEEIKKIMTPKGALIIIDTTADSYSLLTSLELKGGLNNFEDVRKEREQTFFVEEDWVRMFADADFDTVITYPAKNDEFSDIGQKVFVNMVNISEVELDVDDIKNHLKKKLLSYMVPGKIKILKELPLSANGKIDRKKLKQIEYVTKKGDGGPEEGNMTPLQKCIAEIWMEVLNIQSVAVDDNFYSVGGDSLLIAQIVSKLRDKIPEFEKMRWDDLMRDILKEPTIIGLSRLVEEDGDKISDKKTDEEKDIYHDSRCMHTYQKGNGKRVTAFFHAGTGRIKDYAMIAPELCNADKDRTVVGFTYGDEELYLQVPADKLIDVRANVYANRLEELHADSYQLVGYCVGGFVAMETAKAMMERGLEVEPVLAISSHLCLHSIENQLLFESAYGVILGADIFKAGYRGNPEIIRCALEHILQGEDRDVTNAELCTLDGDYDELGKAFTALTTLTHEKRMENIYNSIDNPDFAGEQSTMIMLNILYDVFEHTYKAMIKYKPDFFSGDLIALLPDTDLMTTYPVMREDTDWDEFVLGDCKKYVVHGDHNTCIDSDNYKQIMKYLI